MTKFKILISTLVALAAASCTQEKSPVDYVNPYMGNVSHLLVPTYPTVHLPNGMLRVYPERPDYTADLINGLPLIVTSHRGSSAFNLSFAQGDTKSLTRVSKYYYDNEVIKPYFYKVYLQPGISVEYAPSYQSAVYQIEFDQTLGNSYMIVNVKNGALEVNENTVSGWQTIDNSLTKIYLYAQCEQKPIAVGTIKDSFVADSTNVEQGAVVIDFGNIDKVNMRYGISFISVEQAKQNLEREINTYSVKSIADAGRKIWNETLGKFEVTGGSDTDKEVFYTSLYRTYERMINVSEGGRYFSPFDGAIHNDEGHNFYNDDWVWDTYRAVHPLRILTEPQKELDMIVSYIRMAQQSPQGWLPTFPEVTGDSHRMNGNHAIISIWDAHTKGMKFDLEAAYKACYGALRGKSLLPWTKVPQNELDAFYEANGFYPALNEGELETCKDVNPLEKRQPIAVILGDSYDSWCMSLMAKKLGKSEDAEYFADRVLRYRNVFNADTKFFHPKNSKGEFIEPFDYRYAGGMGCRDYYDENNGWTYRWDLPHNIDQLIELMGGKQEFSKNLDQTFIEPLGKSKFQFYAQIPDHTGNVGQFSMANEPSLHIPYLYNYVGEPWKTQKRVRTLIKQWFRSDLMGVSGDEDGGGMSAFVVFTQMGFYPVTPGSTVYSIGSPIFETVSLKLGNGKTFNIEAKNCSDNNKYIQSATLNGKELNAPFIDHSDIINGGKLKMVMGDKPNYKWGIN